MNENYSAQRQMQKGFKTFILTLSISLIVFSVIYYLISDTQSSTDLSSVNGSNQVADASGTQVLGSTDENSTPIESVEKKEETVFGKISSTPVNTTSRAVLSDTAPSPAVVKTTTTTTTGAGVTTPKVVKTTTTAAVPNGGVTELTWGFFISVVAFALGFLVISKDPRKMAIQHFEKKMLK